MKLKSQSFPLYKVELICSQSHPLYTQLSSRLRQDRRIFSNHPLQYYHHDLFEQGRHQWLEYYT